MGEDAAAWRLGLRNKKAEKRKKEEGKLDDKLPTGRKAKRVSTGVKQRLKMK